MVWSSSLWGCELKRICKWYHPLRIRHPPCEDVSWKVKDHASEITETVILLVRMWVEKLYGVARHYRTTVILLVRMWVENPSCKNIRNIGSCHPPCEDVSWKVLGPLLFMLVHRHPPCEDVSWKSLCLTFLSRFHWSSSLWGCELKILSLRHDSSRLCHPPCEDVSWKS